VTQSRDEQRVTALATADIENPQTHIARSLKKPDKLPGRCTQDVS